MQQDDSDTSRLETELSLLEAIYPDQVSYDSRSNELSFTPATRSKLVLRIPTDYPSKSLPTIISANATRNRDLRNAILAELRALETGTEILDVLLDKFSGLAEQDAATCSSVNEDSDHVMVDELSGSKYVSSPIVSKDLTVIIWTHHLLATTKRKLILDPPAGISGISKPGYPGVIIYSGPENELRDQVKTLRAQNWQAFQVRFESAEKWSFEHGENVREVESMGEVVQGIVEEEGGSKGQGRRETVLGVLKIK